MKSIQLLPYIHTIQHPLKMKIVTIILHVLNKNIKGIVGVEDLKLVALIYALNQILLVVVVAPLEFEEELFAFSL